MNHELVLKNVFLPFVKIVKIVITSRARHKITRKLHHVWRRILQDTQQEAAQVQHDRSEFI